MLKYDPEINRRFPGKIMASKNKFGNESPMQNFYRSYVTLRSIQRPPSTEPTGKAALGLALPVFQLRCPDIELTNASTVGSMLLTITATPAGPYPSYRTSS